MHLLIHAQYRSEVSPESGLTLALLLQLVALYRSLRLKDDDTIEYRTTVRWFVGSSAVLVATLFVAALEYAGFY